MTKKILSKPAGGRQQRVRAELSELAMDLTEAAGEVTAAVGFVEHEHATGAMLSRAVPRIEAIVARLRERAPELRDGGERG